MRIDKSQVISLLDARGDHATASQADRSLPASLDTERDVYLLHRFGVEARELELRDSSDDGQAGACPEQATWMA